MGIQEIIDRVARDPCRHVVITGGEPFLARGLAQLTIRLRDRGHHITVETAGTVAARVACDLMSVSPKLSHSTPRERRQGRFAEMHERRRLNFGALQALVDGYDYQLKFVVEKPGDFGEIEQVLGRLRNVDRGRVLVMAQARTKRELRARSRWLVGQAKMRGFGYSPRLQIELFGNRRGV